MFQRYKFVVLITQFLTIILISKIPSARPSLAKKKINFQLERC